MATYASALNKINEVKEEVNDGANTASRVGLAMKEVLDHAKGVGDNADAAILAEQTRAQSEEAKKPDIFNLYGFDTTQPLPLGKSYVYKSKPVQSVCGDRDNGGSYIAFSIGHENNDGYEAYNHEVMLFISESSAPDVYMFNSNFNTGEDNLTPDQDSAAMALGAGLASTSRAGLMSEVDKANMNALLTEVFPLVVAIASSNAGTYEKGDASHAITPNIQLSITRRGSDVAADAVVTVSSGNVSSDNKTITDSPIYDNSKTINITVVQGGQTRNAPNQIFSFKNYLYKGSFASSQKAAVKANLVSAIKSKTKVLSDDTTLAPSGGVQLNGGDCYLFAVKGHVNLVVKNAKSGGTISVDSSDKGFINDFPQENNPSLTNEYSWIIVPASSNTWYFQITNS